MPVAKTVNHTQTWCFEPHDPAMGTRVAGRQPEDMSAHRINPPPLVRVCRLLTRCLDLGWDGDAAVGGVAAELVQGGEPVRAGGEGVADLVQQLADVADAAVEGFGCDLEQPGEGFLGQAVAVAEEGGGEPGGEGELGVAAGAGGGLARAVVAVPGQAGFAKLASGGGQGGGQEVPLAGGQAGEG